MAKRENEISTREAAAILGCGQQTVCNYWRAGLIVGRAELRGARGASRIWLDRESVERLAAQREE